MIEYEKISIDFEVYKEITVRRVSPDHSPNDVLRELFGLKPDNTSAENAPDWTYKGATLKSGTRLRANYNGQTHSAEIKDGKIFIKGESRISPTAAAQIVTGGSRNGWTFWEYENPANGDWRSIYELRTPNS